MSKKLSLGKLPQSLLTKLIQDLPTESKDLLVPPGIGRDAAGLRIGQQLVAVTADPITLTSDRLATYSVAVNVNDIACLGCRPKWYLGVLLLPPNFEEYPLRKIWKELSAQLRQYDITAIGGHAEVTSAVIQPVLIGQIIGETLSDQFLDPARATSGDQILLWQQVAIEGTALMAQDKAAELKKHFSAQSIKRMQRLLDDPGICIWPFVERCLPCPGVVAMHDPTEGGLCTAIHELADAAQTGVVIDYDQIPFLPETLTLANHFHFDPLGLLASGCLIMVCKPNMKEKLLNQFQHEPLVCIGELTDSKKRILKRLKHQSVLPRYDQDQLITVLSSSRKRRRKSL